MKKDLIKKIKRVTAKGKSITEEDIRALMGMIRKLLERMSDADRQQYLTLNLFCNWAAHTKITQSNIGLRILAKVNDTLVQIRNSKDLIEIRLKMSQAIGTVSLRQELTKLFRSIGVSDDLVLDDNLWGIVFLNHLIEIIRDVPLSFPQLSTLDKTKLKIYNQIAQNPIKPGAGVVAIWISLVDYSKWWKDAGEMMCLFIRTEDTTTTIIPLLIDVRLK